MQVRILPHIAFGLCLERSVTTKGAYSKYSQKFTCHVIKPVQIRTHLDLIKEEKKTMLEFLKRELNRTRTENGAAAFVSTESFCLDLFATAGALRQASDEEIISRFVKAFAEDRDLAVKTLFFARDIRGGLGERRFFKVILKYLAEAEPETVIKNIANIAEYGRYDDILVLIGTPCEQAALEYIRSTLAGDIQALNAGGEVSLRRTVNAAGYVDRAAIRVGRDTLDCVGN